MLMLRSFLRRPVKLLNCVPNFGVTVHLNGLESNKGQRLHQQKLFSTTETTAPETPRQHPAFKVVPL